MKTIYTKLLAALLTTATVTAATFPSAAQRRTTQRNQEKNSRVEQPGKSHGNTVREKSTFKEKEIRRRIPKESTRRATRIDRPDNQKNLNRPSPNRNGKKAATVNNGRKNNSKVATHSNSSRRQGAKNSPALRKAEPRKNAVANSSENARYANSGRRITPQGSKAARVRSSNEYKREVYRLDKNDARFKTNKNYRGSKNYWNKKRAPNRVHYKKHPKNYYINYNYNNYNHWDRKWERYRWNLASWRDYYSSYHPYSYRFHKHYYHHPKFGHVIRTFEGRPGFFVHNRNRYYVYNGQFFRFFRGVGYVLVDMPYGIVFEQLPSVYEQVFINGYLYFRVGNLFFEMANHGFRLVHYPERYYALNKNYYNNGYYYQDDFRNYD